MIVWKRLAAAFILLLGIMGLLLSIAGGVGVWIIKEPVTERMTHVFNRLDAALKAADEALAQVKTSLANAAKRLEEVKVEQQKLAEQPQKDSALGRLLARKLQKIAPDFGGAQDKLQTIGEAAVVVNSVLEDLGNIPFLSAAGLDDDRLKKIHSLLSDVTPAAWELSRLLGESAPEADASVSNIERMLATMQGLIAEYEPQLQQARGRTEDLKSRVLDGIPLAAVIISLACLWIALGQLSLLCHGLSWWKSAGHRSAS
ncbi:MAG TPA: hypothetical protein VKE98_05485 [Gemmataceae bacterium]|nr:hypothetical protein [Gemmataceae bacterium]